MVYEEASGTNGPGSTAATKPFLADRGLAHTLQDMRVVLLREQSCSIIMIAQLWLKKVVSFFENCFMVLNAPLVLHPHS